MPWPVNLMLFARAVVAFALGAALTLLVRRAAVRRGWVSLLRSDRWHRQPVALFGGVAIFLSTMAPVVASMADSRVIAMAAGATVMFVLGLVDDTLKLKPFTKLMVQVAVAALMVRLDFSLGWFVFAPLDNLATIVWIVGVTNAFNLLDNMDGLACGVGLIAAIGVVLSQAVLLQGVAQAPGAPMYAAALAGALGAFLLFNFQPATIFMGDSGSLFVGVSLALLVLVPESTGAGIVDVIAVPTLILLIPIVDTTLVTVVRKLSGRAASTGGIDHLSHRLVALGYSERRAVAILCVLAALGGLLGAAVRRIGSGAIPLIAILVIGLVLFGVRLARVRVYKDQDFALLRNRRYTPLLAELTHKRRVFELLLDLVLIVIAYYSAYQIRFEGQDFNVYYPRLVDSLPIVIACKIVSLYIGGVYKGVWRYFGLSDLTAYLAGVALGSASSVAAIAFVYRFRDFSRGVFIIDGLVLLVLLIGSRLSFRAIGELAQRYRHPECPVFIYGAGDGGALLVRELRNNRRHGFTPVGFIDDDVAKQGRKILGLPVLGGVDALPDLLEKQRVVAILLSTAKIHPDRLIRLRRIGEESGIRLVQLRFELRQLLSSA